MRMVIDFGRGTAGMAKNRIKSNIIGLQCAVECFKPHLTCSTTKPLVSKTPKKQGFNAHPMLSFNDALAVTPGISPSANIVRLSPSNCSITRRQSRLPRMSIRVGQWSNRGIEAPITWHALFSSRCH